MNKKIFGLPVTYPILSFLCWFFAIQSVLNAFPSVYSVSPASGVVVGGNRVTIEGAGFIGTTRVDFGSRQAVSFTVIDDSTISAIVPTGTVGTVEVVVSAMNENSALSPNDFYTYTTDHWDAIVSATTPNGVALFNTTTNSFDAFIPLLPSSLASVMTPDGKIIYTADSSIPGVTVIDAATHAILTNIPTSVGPGAFDIIVNPSGTRVYLSNNLSGFVTVVDTATNTVVTDIFVGQNLGPLSITPDGSTVYVSNFTYGNVTAIDTATNVLGISISTGITPGMISITPDGTKAFVCNLFSDTISVIDLASQTVVNSIASPSGAGPYGSSILPNGLTMYVANLNNSTVSVVDVASEMITDTIVLPVELRPFWVASTPDSKTVYLINESNNQLTPIDVATNTVGVPFGEVATNLQDIVISPDPAPVAQFTFVPQPIGVATLFDASPSLSPIGTIVSYGWDFGDGVTTMTSSPFIAHTYNASEVFTVTLTVTNSAGTSTGKVFSSRFMSNAGAPSAVRSQPIQAILLPPSDLKGIQTRCRFASQTDIVNLLSWSPAAVGERAVSYEIFSDAALQQLIGVVSANGALVFADHNREKKVVYTYYVVSVSATGGRSLPAMVAIP